MTPIRKGLYKILRVYRNPKVHQRVVWRGKTLEQAQEYLKGKEASSDTCERRENRAEVGVRGGYDDMMQEM
jgi:hypothetical protein